MFLVTLLLKVLKHCAVLLALVGFIFSSCEFDAGELGELQRLYESGEISEEALRELVRSINRSGEQGLLRSGISAGSGLYIGQALENIGEFESAGLLYALQFSEGDALYSDRALEKLLDILLELERYEEIITHSSEYIRNYEPDPVGDSWLYTHRFEALTQAGLGERAFGEVQALVRKFPYLFSFSDSAPSPSSALPHGLLYYRARIAAQVARISDLDSHILPYAVMSSARSGHEAILKILEERFPLEERGAGASLSGRSADTGASLSGQSAGASLSGRSSETRAIVENTDVYAWLMLKSLLLRGEYSEALDEFAVLLESPSERIYEFLSMRLQEGIALDLFRAGVNSNRREEAIRLFEGLDAGIPQGFAHALLLSAQFRSYSARLLQGLNRDEEAVDFFRLAFFAMREYRSEITAGEGAGNSAGLGGIGSAGGFDGLNVAAGAIAVLSALSRMQELMLWRWVGAILGNSDASDYSALLLARNPDFFYDILDEFISGRVRQYRFGDLADFLAVFSDDYSQGFSAEALGDSVQGFAPDSRWGSANTAEVIPRSLRVSTERIVEMIAGSAPSGSFAGVQDNGASTSTNPSENERIGSLLDRALLFMDLEVSEATIDHLFALPRGISYRDSGISGLPLSDAKVLKYNEILKGYGNFGLYREAVDYLDSLPANYEADPELILSIAARAYSEAEWYSGLRLVERALWRTYAFGGDGAGNFIAAAGGVEELLRYLFPEAWAERVGRYTRQYNVNPYLYIALMREESRFNARAGSHAGALGLGQIIPATADDIARQLRMGEYDLFDPDDNIPMSLFYISQLSERFSTVWEILSGYNAGPGRVRRWNSELPLRDLTARRVSRGLGNSTTERASGAVSGVYYLGHVPFEETRNYMRRVVNSFLIYDYLYCQSEEFAGVQDSLLREGACSSSALSIHWADGDWGTEGRVGEGAVHRSIEESEEAVKAGAASEWLRERAGSLRYARLIHGDIVP